MKPKIVIFSIVTNGAGFINLVKPKCLVSKDEIFFLKRTLVIVWNQY